MTGWIKKEIDPPGMEKKGRGSLYRFIGRVFGRVRDDAEKAFRAFFPYLADSDKLRKHGASLSIPEMPFDTEDEFRDRVTTASFYLMRAGERAYILEQLRAHFADRFSVEEHFLHVRVKIFNITDKDRAWAIGFLDGILDPNIRLDLGQIFDIADTMPAPEDSMSLTVRPVLEDTLNAPLLYNGAVNYDGETINDTVYVDSEYDGESEYDGSLSYDATKETDRTYDVKTDFTYSTGTRDLVAMDIRFDGFEDTLPIDDSLSMAIKADLADTVEPDDSLAVAIKADLRDTLEPGDSFSLSARVDTEDKIETADSFTIGIRYEHEYDGSCGYDGSVGYDSTVLNALGG
jgi:hypothetical protein